MNKQTYDRLRREGPEYKDRNNILIKRYTSDIYLNVLKHMKSEMSKDPYHWLNRHLWDIKEEIVTYYKTLGSFVDLQVYIYSGNEPYEWEMTTPRITKLLKINYGKMFTIGSFRKYSPKHKSSRPFLTGVFNG